MKFSLGPKPGRTHERFETQCKINAHSFSSCCIVRAPVAAPRERTMTMSVHKRGTKWHYAFCIRGVRYRGAIPEASTKFDAEKAETKIRQDVYEGRYGRLTGNKDFGKFVEEVYKPWAMENKRSFKSNDKYKLSIICESKCFKGKTFAQISPLLIGKVQEGAT
jgi:hypothetical protein